MKIAVCIKQVPDSWAEKKMVGGLLDRGEGREGADCGDAVYGAWSGGRH